MCTVPDVAGLSDEVQEILGVEGVYQEFIRMQEKEIEVLKREESLPLPEPYDYIQVPTLSTEEVEILNAVRDLCALS
jgi:tRNA uridine 5-carboxymethylaminomethyl modification enzyme